MSEKTIVSIFAGISTTIGGCIPMLWGDDPLGGWSILLALVGGLVGVWVGVKVGNMIG